MFRDKRDETRRPNILPVGYKREKNVKRNITRAFSGPEKHERPD